MQYNNQQAELELVVDRGSGDWLNKSGLIVHSGGALLRSTWANMPSTQLRPSVITEHIAKEMGKGRLMVHSYPRG